MPCRGSADPQATAAARYNQGVKGSTIATVALGTALALLSGCKKNIQNNDAVKQGIMTYLAKRSDLLAMEVSVTSVAFHDDQATATVRFQAKGNTSPTAGMSMDYILDRKDNQWVVKGRAGADQHSGVPPGGPNSPGAAGSTGSLGAMPNMGGSQSGMPPGSMPPGHPSVGGAPSGSLPPGHPPLGNDKKE